MARRLSTICFATNLLRQRRVFFFVRCSGRMGGQFITSCGSSGVGRATGVLRVILNRPAVLNCGTTDSVSSISFSIFCLLDVRSKDSSTGAGLAAFLFRLRLPAFEPMRKGKFFSSPPLSSGPLICSQAFSPTRTKILHFARRNCIVLNPTRV